MNQQNMTPNLVCRKNISTRIENFKFSPSYRVLLSPQTEHIASGSSFTQLHQLTLSHNDVLFERRTWYLFLASDQLHWSARSLPRVLRHLHSHHHLLHRGDRGHRQLVYEALALEQVETRLSPGYISSMRTQLNHWTKVGSQWNVKNGFSKWIITNPRT